METTHLSVYQTISTQCIVTGSAGKGCFLREVNKGDWPKTLKLWEDEDNK